MTVIVIDLQAFVVPQDHTIWKCHPGKTYRFYQAAFESSAVFLDIRGLGEALLGESTSSNADLLKLLASDRWQREVERADLREKPKGSPNVSKIDRRNLTYLKGLLFEAKKGDLVVVPPSDWQKEPLIGELVDEPGRLVPVVAVDAEREHTYVGRKVVWRPTVQKRQFSAEMIKKFHTATALFALPKSLNDEIYRVAYGNYVVDENFVARFDTSKEVFTPADNAVVSLWLNALDAVRRSVEAGNIDELPDDFLLIGLAASPEGDASALAININSPGSIVAQSAGVFALAVMAIFPLSQVDASESYNGSVRVKVQTVGSADRSCEVKVERAIRSYMDALGLDRWKKQCEIAVRAKNDATLVTKARLKSEPKRAK